MSGPGFPIIISNEPPPCGESDEDEDLDTGEFHSTGLNLDVLTDQSPFSTPRKVPFPAPTIDQSSETEPESQSSDIEIVCTNHKSPAIKAIYENGDCHSDQSGSEKDEVEDDGEILSIVVKQEQVLDEEVIELPLEKDLNNGYHDSDPDLAIEPNSDANLSDHEFNEPESNNCNIMVQEAEFKEVIESDQIIERTGESDITIPQEVEIDTGQLDEDLQQNIEAGDEDDDEFGDFGFTAPAEPVFVGSSKENVAFDESSTSAIQNPACEVEDGPKFTANFDDEDFGDFESSEVKEVVSETKLEPPAPALELKGTFESMIKSIFPHESKEIDNKPFPFAAIDKKLSSSPGSVWNHVNEFEDSRCLQFKWSESRVHQQLLSSLNIDTSTVLYRGKWGAIEVPKFAANLVDVQGCLQPEVSFQPIHNETDDNGGSKSPSSLSKCTAEDDSPINEVPREDDQKKTNSQKPLSREATRVLEQLPDLSYMRAKTLIFPRTPKY